MARTYTKVGEEFVQAGGGRTVTFDLPFSATTAFAALGDAASWKAWMDIDVNWTSPKPFGVGTTRTVVAGGQSIDEEFFAWDEGRRMAFCFVQGGLPVRSMIENYVLEDMPGGGCQLHWTLKADGLGPLKHLLYRLMQGAAKKGLPKFIQWVEDNQAA